MKKPEMIIFDYGNTLFYETEIDFQKGERAVFKYVVQNPYHINPEYAADFGIKLFQKYEPCRRQGFEIHEQQILRAKYDMLGIKFNITLEEAERVIMENSASVKQMPHIAQLLSYLENNGIRTGIISNIAWSGKALENRIAQALPEHKFEFIIASSEYSVRKPDVMLFEVALRKAGLKAQDVWYCGDNIKADVQGANESGIFPVLYEGKKEKENMDLNHKDKFNFEFEYLYINDWMELIERLKSICN